jgi:hypothetical protein
MKREDHFAQLVLAALSGVLAMVLGTAGIVPYGSDAELGSFLLADVLCGLSILLIISCLRRGYAAVKVGALLVCLFPILHIYHSIERNDHIIREWMKR